MKLIIILIALGLVKYLDFGKVLARLNWFNHYLKLAEPITKTDNTIANTIFAILPPLVVLGILLMIFGHFMYGFIYFLISLAVLMISLGESDVKTELQTYFLGSTQTASANDANAASNVTSVSFNDQSIAETILWQNNERVFAVIFWFVILGPLGALLYRLTLNLSNSSEQAALAEPAKKGMAFLDWIPVRLTALFFALVGNFVATFSYWIPNALSPLSMNQTFLYQSGYAAINKKESTKFSPEINHELLALEDRALILFLVLVALFTLGSWIS